MRRAGDPARRPDNNEGFINRSDPANRDTARPLVESHSSPEDKQKKEAGIIPASFVRSYERALTEGRGRI